jgi:glutamyl-tRNA synthetase
VDDLEMKITHVIRGEDHLMNTPKHLQLIEALGGVAPAYAHIPLIQNANGSKMSKRDVGAAVGDYIGSGYTPSALVNYLALLGWSSKSEEEIFTMQELTERFSLEAVNRSPARFDAEKCAWVNQQHLLRMSAADFAASAREYVVKADLPVGENFAAAAAAVQEKVRLLSEVPEALRFLLVDEFPIEESAWEKIQANAQAGVILQAIHGALAGLGEWNADSAKAALSDAAASIGAKAGAMMFPLRVALSGKSGGPDLMVILALLGRERCLQRIETLQSKRG